MQLLPLNDGGILFGATDPSFGIIDSQGVLEHFRYPGSSTSAARSRRLSLSRDGKIVEVTARNHCHGHFFASPIQAHR